MTENITNLHRDLGRIEGKVDSIITALSVRDATVDKALASHSERLNNHAERLRPIERRQAIFLSGLSAVGVAVGWAVAYVQKLLPGGSS